MEYWKLEALKAQQENTKLSTKIEIMEQELLIIKPIKEAYDKLKNESEQLRAENKELTTKLDFEKLDHAQTLEKIKGIEEENKQLKQGTAWWKFKNK